METYNRIVMLVKEKGITMKKFREDLSIVKSAIFNWKNGVLPSTPILIKIADYFDVSTDFLLGRTNNRNSNKESKIYSVNILELIKKIANEHLSESEIDAVLHYIDNAVHFNDEEGKQ